MAGTKHVLITGGFDSDNEQNKKAHILNLEDGKHKIIEDIPFEMNDNYPGIYTLSHVIICSYPKLAQLSSSTKLWGMFNIKRKKSHNHEESVHI